MITLEQIKEVCECATCCYDCRFAEEFKMCLFRFDPPQNWNIEEIEKRLKKGEDDGT